MTKEICEIKGCQEEATRMTSTESKYIMICEKCWHNRYKIQNDSKYDRYALEGNREALFPSRRHIRL